MKSEIKKILLAVLLSLITMLLCTMFFSVLQHQASVLHSTIRLKKMAQIKVADNEEIVLYIFQIDLRSRRPFIAFVQPRISETFDLSTITLLRPEEGSGRVKSEIANDLSESDVEIPPLNITNIRNILGHSRVFIYLTSDGRYGLSNQLPSSNFLSSIDEVCSNHLPLGDINDVSWRIREPSGSVNYVLPFDNSSAEMIKGKSEIKRIDITLFIGVRPRPSPI